MSVLRLEPREVVAETAFDRRRLGFETLFVVVITLGSSAVYSVLSFIRTYLATLQAGQSLASQTQTINQPITADPLWEPVYQLLSVVFALVPVALVMVLLWQRDRSAPARIGLSPVRAGRDALAGLGLAAVIGVPGIAVYLVGKALGLSVTVVPTALGEYWWTVPVLVLAAVRAALIEEVVGVGYVFTRLQQLGWRPWVIIAACAALRGSYHLYQGPGALLGNAAMGVLFGWAYFRFGRVGPLIVAHFFIDTVAFVGYPVAVQWFPTLFGTPAG